MLQPDESDLSGVGGNEHLKAMWAGQSNVLVAVRVRPILKHDRISKGIVKVLNKVVVIEDPAKSDKLDILRANRAKDKQYAFDYVFGPTSTQEDVYNSTTKFLIHGVLDGFNGTVFCYGMTGAGKTHTMIGSENDPGIMVRVMSDLFLTTKAQGKRLGMSYKVSASFIEVYNENLRDLLSDVDEYLDLREDPIKGPTVAGVTAVETFSGEEIMKLLHQGNSRRSQHATAANEQSSRSHAVLQVVVEGKDRAPGKVAKVKVGKLSLVDLAGSERASNTKNTGMRLVEGANINKSLLALGNCINALAEKGNTKGNFVPYRDSKLTRLLKDSLGGNCRTVMIANISAAESCYEETLNTLKYANRAKNIKTTVQRNELDVNYHISEYENLIANLRNEIKLLKDEMLSRRADDAGIPSAMALKEGSELGAGSDDEFNVVSESTTPSVPSAPIPQLSMSVQSLGLGLSMKRNSASRDAIIALASSTDRDMSVVNKIRQSIVDNFQEKMQLRRSLIELEDQNVQNTIEISKRQLVLVHWMEEWNSQQGSSTPGSRGFGVRESNDTRSIGLLLRGDEIVDDSVIQSAPPEIKAAWSESCKLRKALKKNNATKGTILTRIEDNEKEAEEIRSQIRTKVAGADRIDLMELQYQVGKLELEKMELEQTNIVHESIVKGKDLMIQKLKLQLAMKDKLIQRQKAILVRSNLDSQVGYAKFAMLENALASQDFSGEGFPAPSDGADSSEMAVGSGSYSDRFEISPTNEGVSSPKKVGDPKGKKSGFGEEDMRPFDGAAHFGQQKTEPVEDSPRNLPKVSPITPRSIMLPQNHAAITALLIPSPRRGSPITNPNVFLHSTPPLLSPSPMQSSNISNSKFSPKSALGPLMVASPRDPIMPSLGSRTGIAFPTDREESFRMRTPPLRSPGKPFTFQKVVSNDAVIVTRPLSPDINPNSFDAPPNLSPNIFSPQKHRMVHVANSATEDSLRNNPNQLSLSNESSRMNSSLEYSHDSPLKDEVRRQYTLSRDSSADSLSGMIPISNAGVGSIRNMDIQGSQPPKAQGIRRRKGRRDRSNKRRDSSNVGDSDGYQTEEEDPNPFGRYAPAGPRGGRAVAKNQDTTLPGDNPSNRQKVYPAPAPPGANSRSVITESNTKFQSPFVSKNIGKDLSDNVYLTAVHGGGGGRGGLKTGGVLGPKASAVIGSNVSGTSYSAKYVDMKPPQPQIVSNTRGGAVMAVHPEPVGVDADRVRAGRDSLDESFDVTDLSMNENDMNNVEANFGVEVVARDGRERDRLGNFQDRNRVVAPSLRPPLRLPGNSSSHLQNQSNPSQSKERGRDSILNSVTDSSNPDGASMQVQLGVGGVGMGIRGNANSQINSHDYNRNKPQRSQRYPIRGGGNIASTGGNSSSAVDSNSFDQLQIQGLGRV